MCALTTNKSHLSALNPPPTLLLGTDLLSYWVGALLDSIECARPTRCTTSIHPTNQPPPCWQVFELLDALLDSMECGSNEAAQQLDLLRPPLLAELRQRGRHTAAASLSLLATLCQQRPDAVQQLREEGAAASVAQHLMHGTPAE